jgi:SAM-dependent methyltransferase
VERGLVFDRIAADYDRVRPGYPATLIDSALAGGSIRRVLEVGCGTGQLIEALVARGLEVVAIEPGATLPALAQRRAPGAEIHVGRFEDSGLPAESFDRVVGWAEAARLLRPGGALALLTHVYGADEESRPAQEALRDVYAAPWSVRDQSEVTAGALARRPNVSEVLEWLEGGGLVRPEAGELFGEATITWEPHEADLDASELLDLQRTTATHLTLDPERVEEVERGIVALVERLGGRFPLRQLAVLALAQRR